MQAFLQINEIKPNTMTQSDPKIIEELADKWYKANGKKIYSDYDPRFAFIAGAKYQSEQMYSEDEVNEYVNYVLDGYYLTIKKWKESKK